MTTSRSRILKNSTRSWTNLHHPTSNVSLILWTCREYSDTRDYQNDGQKGVLGANTVSGPVWDVNVTRPFGRCCIEVQIDSVSGVYSQSWGVISRGVVRYASEISAKQSHYVFWRIRPCPFWLRGNDSKHRLCNKIQCESYTTEKVGGQLSSGKDSSNLDRKPTESNAALVVIDPLFKEMLPAAAVQQSLLPLVVHTQLLPHLFCGDGFPLPLLTFARSSATERFSRSDCDEGYVFVKSCEP